MGLVAKSYMRKGFLIYEEYAYVRRPLVIYDFAPDPCWISLHMRKIFFSFYECSMFLQKERLCVDSGYR